MGGFTPEELAAMRAGKISNYNDYVTFRDSVQKSKQRVEEDLKNKGNARDSQVEQNTVDFTPSTSHPLQTQPPTQEDTAQQDTTLQPSNPIDFMDAYTNKLFKSQIFGGGHTEKSPLVQTKEEDQKYENGWFANANKPFKSQIFENGLLSTSSIVEKQQKEEYNNSMKEEYNNSMKDIQQRKKDAINLYLNLTQDKPSRQEGNYPNDYFGKSEDYSKERQPILSDVLASDNAVYKNQLDLRTELFKWKVIGAYQKAVMDELNVAAEDDPKLKQDVINLAKETVKDNGVYKFYKDDEKFDYTDADWYKAGLKIATSQDEVLNQMHNNSRGTDYNPVEDVIGDMQLRVAENQSGIEKAQNLGLQIIGDGWSTACMIGGVAYGLASSGIDLGINLYQGQDFIDALANAGLHIINNDITQYGVGVVETGSWAFDLEKQRELMREGLNKDAILGEGVGNETLRSMGSWGFTLASMGWGAVATKGVLAATTSLERKALRNGIKATRKELGSEVTEAAINDIKKEIRTSWIKKNSIVKSSAIPLMTATPEATLEAGSTYLHALDEGTTKIDETIQRHVDDYVNKKAQEFYDAQQKNPKENKLIIDPSPNMINQWRQEGEALYTAKYQDAYKRIESDAKTATAINFFTNMAILSLSQATVQSTYLPKPVQSALKKSKVFGFANNIKPIYIRDAEGKLIKKFTPAQKVYMALRESGGETVEEFLQTTSQNINEGVVEGDITDYINKKYAADGGNVVGQSFGEHFGSAFVAFSNSLSAEETWEAAGSAFFGTTIGGFGITHTGKFMFDFGRTGNYKTRKVRDPQTGELKVEYVTDSKGNKVEEKAVFKRGVNADGSKENWLDVAARMTPWRTGIGTTFYQETLRERTAFKDDAKRVEDFMTAYRTNGNWNGSLLDGLVGTVNAAADIEAAAETNDIFNMKNASVQQAVETSFVLNDLQNSEGLGKTLADEMLENINMTANADEGSEIAQRLVNEYKQSDDFKKKEAAGVKMTDAQILQELKKSSNYMLDILNQVNETTEMVEATYGHFGLDNDTKQALVYSHIAVDNMSKRIDVLTEEINKLKYNTTRSASSLSDSQKALVSKYDGGLKEAIQRKTNIEKQIKSLDAKITNLNAEKKKFEKNPNSKITFSQSALDKITSERNKLVAELEQFKELEGLNYESGVLNEDEIMHLPVKQRAAMLLNGYEDIYNKTHDASKRVGKPKTSRLSQAQQNIVNDLRRKLLEQDPQAMEKIIDVARLNVSKDRHVKQQEQIITDPKTFKDFVRKARMATLESQWMKDYVKLDNIADYNEFKKQFLPLFNSEEQLDLLKLSSIMKKLHTSSNKNFERWMKEDEKLTQQYEYIMNRCSAMDALNDDERTVFTAMLDWASLHCSDAFTYSKKGTKIKGFSFEKLQTALESEYNKGDANTFIPLVRGTYGIKSDVIPENLESLTSFFNILKESYDDKGVASPQETSNKSSRTAAKPSVSVTPNSEPVEETTEGHIEEFVQGKPIFDVVLARKIQDKLQKLYPEIKLNITNNPAWEQGDNIFDQKQALENEVAYRLNVVNSLINLTIPKGDKRYSVGDKPEVLTIRLNSKKQPYIETNLRKRLNGKGVTNQQIDFIFDYMKSNNIQEISTEQLALELANKYGFSIEVNTAKEELQDYEMVDVTGEGDFQPQEFIPDTELVEEEDEDGNIIGVKEVLSEKGKKQIEERENKRKPTQHYSDLTVPGGTNYTENKIETPLITPSIQGHPKWVKKDGTDKGIGWFRSDDKVDNAEIEDTRDPQIELDENGNYIQVQYGKLSQTGGTNTKTRRILEIQSDLFQKGRDKKDLLKTTLAKPDVTDRDVLNEINKKIEEDETGFGIGNKVTIDGITYERNVSNGKWRYKEFQNIRGNETQNQFLQLLNKDSNWVKFFISAIIQDSAKKGYEKVLFPKGDTLIKIESAGHYNYNSIEDAKNANEEKLVNTALFYEIKVGNILEKQFGKDNVKTITDEYGNQWREIEINQARDLKDILLQRNEANQIIGQANIQALTVLVDAIKQKQDTLPHEYAHHYIAWFRNTPIVQEAIKKWGSEEALVQSIGEQVVKQKGEAYNWWNNFVKWIMNQFNSLSKLQKEELTQILTDAFLTRQDLGFNEQLSLEDVLKEDTLEELLSPEEEKATTIVNEDTGETISVEEQKQNDIEKAFNLKNVDDSKITVEPAAKLSSAIRIADKTNTSSIVVQKNKDGEYEVVKTTEGVTQNVIQGLYNTMQDNSCVKVIGMQEFPTNLFKLVGEYKENGQTFRTYKKLTLQEESSAQEEKYGPSITNLPAASTQRVATSDILYLKQQDETKGTTTFSKVIDFYENNIVPTLKQVYQKLQNKQNVEVFFVVDQELDNVVSSSMGNKYDPLKYSGVVAVIEVEKGTGKYQIGGKDYSPIGIVPTGNARTNAPEGFYVSQEIRSRAYDVKHKKLRTNVLLKGEDKNPLKSKLLKVNAKQPKHLDVNISAKQFAERTWKNNADEEFLSRLVFDPKRKGTKWYVKPAEPSAMSNPNHDIFIPYARNFKINGVIIGSTNSNNEQYTVLNIFQNPFNNDVWNDLVQNNVCIEKAADQLKKAIIELKKEENLNLLRDLSDSDLSDEERKQIKKTINENPEIANSLKYMQNQFSLPVSFNIGTTENGVCLVSEQDRFYMANLEDLEKLDLSDAASINQMVYSGLRQFFVDSEGNEKLRLPKDATMKVTNDDGTVITQRIPGAGTPFAYFQVDSKLLSKYQEENDRKALGALKKFYEQGFFEVSAEDDSERMGVAYFSTPENLSEETPKPEVVVTNKDNANIDSPLPTDEVTQTPVYDNTVDNAAPESSPVTTLANQITEDSKEHFENKKARGGNHAILSVTNLLRAQEHSQTIVRSSETSQNEEAWSIETAFGNTIDGAVRNILDSNYEVAINNNKLQRRKKGQRGAAWENFTDFTPNMSERALQKLYTDIVITLNPFIQKGYTILSQDVAVRGTKEIFGDNTPHYANFSGELDLLLLSPDGHSAIIIDMKTSKSISIDNEEYKQQQKTYAECLQKTYPQLTDISAYLFGFTTPRISDKLTKQDDSDQLYITKYGKTEKFEELSVSTQGLIEIDLQNTSVDRVMWDKLTQEQRDEILRQEADKTSQSNATQSSTSETVEDNLFQETSKHIKEQAERKAREEKTETNETEAKPKKTFERRNYRSKNSPEENKKNNCAK